MDDLTGGQVLVAALHKLGVEQLFSVSGGPINAIYDACADGAPALRHVRNEAAAGFMAEATYRASGHAGVAVVTLGPGVTNTVTSCVSAKLAGVPMMVVGGQAPRSVVDRGAGMATDTWSVMQTVTKWAARVFDVERIPEYVGEAWRRAHAPTPGPVYLEISADVLDATLSHEDAERLLASCVTDAVRSASRPARAEVEAVREVMNSAVRPVVLVGDDCFHSADRESVTGFLRHHGAAFATLRLSRGLLADTDPLSIGPGYIPSNPVLARALAEADVIVLLGHHWEFDLEFGSGANEAATIIQVDPDLSRLRRNGRADIAVNASARGFLDAMGDKLEASTAGSVDTAWVEGLMQEWRAHRAASSAAAARVTDEATAMHPVTLVEAVVEAAPEGTVFVTSHGNVDFWADETLEIDGKGAYLRSGQSGTLGAEIPYGVAAALVRDQPTVVFVGDGGVGYAVAELDTAARYGANVLVVVADDHQWTAIALPQARKYGRATELTLAGRDWTAVATGLGAQARRAESIDDVRLAVKELLAHGGPALLQVPIVAVESPYMTHISK